MRYPRPSDVGNLWDGYAGRIRSSDLTLGSNDFVQQAMSRFALFGVLDFAGFGAPVRAWLGRWAESGGLTMP